MSRSNANPRPTAASAENLAVLELTVSNHPGVMAHVCGLFSRRAFNLEGILCLPGAGRKLSVIWLWVARDRRLHQMIKQAAGLQDVRRLRVRRGQQRLFEQLTKMAPGLGLKLNR
jgi:acetolactate synthase I/III small subunit